MMDIIEFGRMIHAEMSAISDAARLGRPTRGATLYCTTFPCHLCAKHIVAAGIERVVFLEPYPKSYSQKLHSDSITFETHIPDKVYFQPFVGISPRRYRDIFEKRKRKDANGKAVKWYEGKPAPLLEDRSAAYIENEEPSAYVALKFFQKRKSKSKIARQASVA
jgi:tRNA(Arg) A34 adenosine deaminase TadA